MCGVGILPVSRPDGVGPARAGVFLIILGLVFYCTGVIFYMRENMPFSNALWHVMVVLGAGTHMAAVGSMLLYYSRGPMRGF